MAYLITGLPAAPFLPLAGLDDAALAERHAQRHVAAQPDAHPCRVTLEDARPGEALILLPYQHQPASSPYRAGGPIFVREGAAETARVLDRVPDQLRRRLLSVRAYDGRDEIVDADVVEGAAAEPLILRLLENPAVAYLHIHFARRGCYAARVERG